MKKNSKKYNKYCLMSALCADIFYLIFTNKNKQKKGGKSPKLSGIKNSWKYEKD